MESVFRQERVVEPCHTDAQGNLTLSALLYYAQEAAGGHCRLLKLDWDRLADRDLFWAVIRQKAQVTRLPKAGEVITVETWPMPTTRSAFPRATVAYDQEGRELFSVIGLWVLMNLKTRSMVLPGKSGIELEGILRGNELPAPGSIAPKELEHQTLRRVTDLELDRNGHMNNARYLDWLAELLPEAFSNPCAPKSFTICYQNEALKGQEITLSWQVLEGSVLQVNAHREKTGVSGGKDAVFAAQLFF